MSNKEKTKKPRAKQIKLSHINKKNKKFDKMSTFILDEEQNLQLKYHEHFGEKKIDALLNEAYEKSSYAIENGLESFQEDTFFLKYVHFLIIKYFTGLQDEIPDDLETQVNIMEQIYDIGLFERIFDEILPPHEVEKVVSKIESFIVNLSNITVAQEKEMRRVAKRIENRDVIHPLDNPPSDMNG